MSPRCFWAGALLLCLLGRVGGPAVAQPSAPTRPAVKAVVDSVAQEHVGPGAIPGAVVAVVRDTSVLFAAGYGVADRATERPADPARTIYRVGSITKLFTTTAALQLDAAGRLELHADVNRVLDDVHVPPRFGAPITLHHLLTHTPGFEERFVGMGVRDASARQALGPYLRRELPRRVRPPGRVASYSNHGMTLAGHLAATAADTGYVSLIRHRILEPLGMRRSAPARRVLPDTLRAAVATPYQRAGDTLVVPPRVYGHLTPAGGLHATATDMAQFMIAHLNDGRAPSGRILAPATTRQMHRRQFTHHPSLAGWAYGFAEHPRDAPRILMHGGGARGYTALLWLVPERDLGVFVACNLPDAALQDALFAAFNGRFLPRPDTTVRAETPPETTVSPAAVAGHYRHVRHAHTTFEKGLALTAHVRVTSTDSGLAAAGLAPTPVQLRPLGNGRFRRSDGGTVVFDGLGDGTAHFLYADAPLAPAYERVAAWASPRGQGLLVGALALVFLGAVIGAGVGWARGTAALSRERWAAAGVGATYLAFFVGVPWAVLSGPQGHTLAFFFGVSPVLKAVLVLPLLALAATAYLTVRLACAWAAGAGSAWGRGGLAIVVLSSGACALLLHYWNLLGWQF